MRPQKVAGSEAPPSLGFVPPLVGRPIPVPRGRTSHAEARPFWFIAALVSQRRYHLFLPCCHSSIVIVLSPSLVQKVAGSGAGEAPFRIAEAAPNK